MHTLRGAIFDMDGTLLDSMAVWDGLMARYFAAYGVRLTAQAMGEMEGMRQQEVVQYVLAHYPACPVSFARAMDELSCLIADRYRSLSRPREGAHALLCTMRARGIRTAVATLTARHHAVPALEAHGLLPLLDHVLTVDDVGDSKYKPTIYLHAAQRLGVPVRDCAVFEDAPYACTTAHKAGFRVVGVLDPSYAAGESELRAASERVVERTFTELHEFFEAMV